MSHDRIQEAVDNCTIIDYRDGQLVPCSGAAAVVGGAVAAVALRWSSSSPAGGYRRRTPEDPMPRKAAPETPPIHGPSSLTGGRARASCLPRAVVQSTRSDGGGAATVSRTRARAYGHARVCPPPAPSTPSAGGLKGVQWDLKGGVKGRPACPPH